MIYAPPENEVKQIKDYMKFFLAKLPADSQAHLYVECLLRDIQFNLHKVPHDT